MHMGSLDVEGSHAEFSTMHLYELTAGSYLVTHQDGKDAVGLESIINFHLFHHSGRGIHCGFPKLLRHHLTQSFKTLNAVVSSLTETAERVLELSIIVAIYVVLTSFHLIERWASNINVAALHESFLIAIKESLQ